MWGGGGGRFGCTPKRNTTTQITLPGSTAKRALVGSCCVDPSGSRRLAFIRPGLWCLDTRSPVSLPLRCLGASPAPDQRTSTVTTRPGTHWSPLLSHTRRLSMGEAQSKSAAGTAGVLTAAGKFKSALDGALGGGGLASNARRVTGCFRPNALSHAPSASVRLRRAQTTRACDLVLSSRRSHLFRRHLLCSRPPQSARRES